MTPEQKAATERLHEAILATQTAFGYDNQFMVTDWMVLTAETRFDDDGDQISAYSRLYSNGQMPDYRALGLLEVHRTYLRNRLGGPGEEE